MSEDARAKIVLTNGREVWRDVRVCYRDVKTGRWIPKEEVEPLMEISVRQTKPVVFTQGESRSLRKRLMEVQAEIALDPEAGARATSAARLVLNMLKEIEQEEQTQNDDQPWFILGRELAREVLAQIEELDGE